jgi:hypothetical protein
MRGSSYLARERARGVVRDVARLAVERDAAVRRVPVRDVARLAVERDAAVRRVPVRDVARLAVERPAALRRVPVRDVARLAVERPAALRRVPVRLDAFVWGERERRFCSRSMSRSRALLSLPLSRRAFLTNF